MKIKFTFVLDIEKDDKAEEFITKKANTMDLAMLLYPLKWWIDGGKIKVDSINMNYQVANGENEKVTSLPHTPEETEHGKE